LSIRTFTSRSAIRFIMLRMFFLLWVRRPPRTTLFPTRRSSDLTSYAYISSGVGTGLLGSVTGPDPDGTGPRSAPVTTFTYDSLRSEEHTSELQSPYDLVCRLLLEKKKKVDPRLLCRTTIARL